MASITSKSSTRFAHVSSTIDTGRHSTRSATSKQVVARRGEVFERISPRDLAHLINPEEDDSPHESAFASTARETGAGPRIVVHAAGDAGSSPTSTPRSSFLLYDVRTPEEYDAVHLRLSLNYPAMAARQDKWPRELVACRHNEHVRVILVDWDERTAPELASRLVLSGMYPHVAILTGGLEMSIASTACELANMGARHAATLKPTTSRTHSRTSSATIAAKPLSVAPKDFGRPHLAHYLEGMHVYDVVSDVASVVLAPHVAAFAKNAIAAGITLDMVELPPPVMPDSMSARGSTRGPASTVHSVGGSPMRLTAGPTVKPTFGLAPRFKTIKE